MTTRVIATLLTALCAVPAPSLAAVATLATLPAVVMLATGPALAQADLTSAKAAGLVGERPDGMLGIVLETVPAETRALIERINAERRAQYGEVAQRTGQDIAKVQAVAGDRLVQATPAGQFVMNAAGRWVRK